MIKKNFFLILIYLFFFSKILNAEIQDKILAKIGNEIITNYDIVNEINTILALSNKQSNQEDFKNLQNMAFQSLKKLSIKKIEIERYKIKDYNKTDLDGYLKTIEKNIGLENLTLRDHFKKYNANYDNFVKSTIVNLKWNSLIFSLYRKQLDVDEELIKSELNSELKKKREIIEFNLSEIILEYYDQEKIDLILKNIEQSGFENTATMYSNSVSSTNKGRIGWIASSSISDKYLEEIKKLKIGEVSKPIKQQSNLAFIKLNNIIILNFHQIYLKIIEKNIIKKKKEEKLNTFSNSHYVNLEKRTLIEINE